MGYMVRGFAKSNDAGKAILIACCELLSKYLVFHNGHLHICGLWFLWALFGWVGDSNIELNLECSNEDSSSIPADKDTLGKCREIPWQGGTGANVTSIVGRCPCMADTPQCISSPAPCSRKSQHHTPGSTRMIFQRCHIPNRCASREQLRRGIDSPPFCFDWSWLVYFVKRWVDWMSTNLERLFRKFPKRMNRLQNTLVLEYRICHRGRSTWRIPIQ